MNSLIRFRLSALFAAAFCLLTLPSFSQPVITSFTTNGVLVCSQLAPDSVGTVQWASSLGSETNWQDLQSGTVAQDGTLQVNVPVPQATVPRFYRVRGTGWPANMALIPAGSFTMGDSFSEGTTNELPIHSVYVSAFYMDKYEVTRTLWTEVYDWATNHGYVFAAPRQGARAANHPIHTITWFNAVKWCNARSEKEGKILAYYADSELSQCFRTGEVVPFVKWDSGYRLATEAEWEKAARGGTSGRRFPWSDTDNITHLRANYYSDTYHSYDTSSTRGNHPLFNYGVRPYTSPVGYFAPNGYGLYDMAGNLWEWCWDWYNESYTSESQTDPRGPPPGFFRVLRGGSWLNGAPNCRTAARYRQWPTYNYGDDFGFRTVLLPGQ